MTEDARSLREPRALLTLAQTEDREGPNASGHTMIDGPTEAGDLELTEANRELVTAFARDVLTDRKLDQLEKYASAALVQHDPHLEDGLASWRERLAAKTGAGGHDLKYERVHRVLAEGNFVMAACEVYIRGVHSSLYHLFRVEAGKIAEHWTTVEPVAPKSEWKNNNGKF